MSGEEKPLIYVVDDEQVIASTVAMILSQKGYSAKAFFSPLDVLEACKQAVPSILVSDVVMPQMSGIDLAIRVRDEYPACKLLLFSGQSATSAYLEDASRRGYSFEVLPKPIHPVELLRRVASLTHRE